MFTSPNLATRGSLGGGQKGVKMPILGLFCKKALIGLTKRPKLGIFSHDPLSTYTGGPKKVISGVRGGLGAVGWVFFALFGYFWLFFAIFGTYKASRAQIRHSLG